MERVVGGWGDACFRGLASSELKTLNLSFCFFHRYLDDIDDEMDPEIEEAYEKFCLESERKRKQ